MIDGTRVGGSENPKPVFIINHEGNSFRVTSPHVDLKSEADPLQFSVTLEKAPGPTNIGSIIDNITIDDKSPKLQEMFEEARKLKEIPENERPRKLLEILRSKVNFAYDDVMEEVAKTDPELAQWVSQNTGPNTTTSTPVSISEVVDSGYGVCRHLSVTMLALAREAGMEATYASYNPPITSSPNKELAMRNVVRKDNGKPLFKSTPVGEIIWSGHAWVEIKTSEGEWIPVDPTTQLIGDNPDDLATFNDANYVSYSTASFMIDDLPQDVWPYDQTSLWMHPGESKKTGYIKINCRPRPQTLRITPKQDLASLDLEYNNLPEPTSYNGPLDLLVGSKISHNALNVRVLDVKPL